MTGQRRRDRSSDNTSNGDSTGGRSGDGDQTVGPGGPVCGRRYRSGGDRGRNAATAALSSGGMRRRRSRQQPQEQRRPARRQHARASGCCDHWRLPVRQRRLKRRRREGDCTSSARGGDTDGTAIGRSAGLATEAATRPSGRTGPIAASGRVSGGDRGRMDNDGRQQDGQWRTACGLWGEKPAGIAARQSERTLRRPTGRPGWRGAATRP
eukprot:SAG22_NODE_3556_length_1644_cov_1.824595_2_plen_210_part_00